MHKIREKLAAQILELVGDFCVKILKVKFKITIFIFFVFIIIIQSSNLLGGFENWGEVVVAEGHTIIYNGGSSSTENGSVYL